MIERRAFTWEVRSEKREDKTVVIGHGAVFGLLSETLGGFREKIDARAFDNVLGDDVVALFNHDPNLVLARTTSGTLKLSVDDKGLAYEYDSPDTSYGRDLVVSMERGDVRQSSFGFTVEEDNWEEDEDGRVVRTILKVKRLYDVSPVTFPAYPDTDVAKRSLDAYMASKKEEEKKPEEAPTNNTGYICPDALNKLLKNKEG